MLTSTTPNIGAPFGAPPCANLHAPAHFSRQEILHSILSLIFADAQQDDDDYTAVDSIHCTYLAITHKRRITENDGSECEGYQRGGGGSRQPASKPEEQHLHKSEDELRAVSWLWLVALMAEKEEEDASCNINAYLHVGIY